MNTIEMIIAGCGVFLAAYGLISLMGDIIQSTKDVFEKWTDDK